MSTTGRCALIARAVALAVLVVAPAAARAGGFSPLTNSRAAQITSQLKARLVKENVPVEALDLFAHVEVANQYNCTFRAYNPHSHALWNVEVGFEPTGRSRRTQHLPLLPAKTSVEVTFSCGYSRGGSFDGLVGGSLWNSKNLAEILETQADTRLGSAGFTEATPGYTVAQGALELMTSADADEARKFVWRLLLMDAGQRTVSKFLAGKPDKEAVDVVKTALVRTDSSSVAELISALLAESGERTSDVAALVESQLGRVCGTQARPGASREALWTKALGISGAGDLQATVLARCQPTGKAMKRAAEMLARSPELAGPVLERTDAKPFAELAKALASTKEGHAALYRFLRYTADEDRFDAVIAQVPADELRDAVLEVAQSQQESNATRKAAYVSQALDGLNAEQPEAARALLLELMKLQSSNAVPLQEMGDVLTARRSWAAAEIAASLEAEVARRATIFRLNGGKLPPGIEPMEYLSKVQPQLEGCAKSMQRVSECGDVLAANEALVSGAGHTPEFLASVTTVLSKAEPRPPTFRMVARQYGRFGLDLEPVVQRVCTLADEEGARHAGDEEELLTIAADIKPDAKCIEETRSSRKWAAAADNFYWTLKGLSLLLPLAGLVLLARWQLKPVKEMREKSLPNESVVAGPGTVSSRLAGPSWPRGLEDTLAEARKAFTEDGSAPGSATAQALAGLRDAVPVLAAQAQTLATEAVSRGNVRSLLLQYEGAVVYLVVVPARYEQPQTLRRFRSFTDGWPQHVERVAHALPADSTDKPLLALVLFVEPDASQVAVVFGLEARGQRLLPGALLDEREAKLVDGRVHPHRGTFALEAAPMPAPAGDNKDSK